MSINIGGGIRIGGGINFISTSPPPTLVSGGHLYDYAGAQTWTCPAGVYSVHVVCVGGGGGGHLNNNYTLAYSGGGGGCGWKNSIPVTPGQSYTLYVGNGGAGGYYDPDLLVYVPGAPGEDSYFISPSTVKGGGGGQAGVKIGGSYVGTGGGSGGTAGSTLSAAGTGGAGGAGGYQGNGGAGGATGADGSAGTGSGAGGGAGGGGGNNGGGGGGVNLFGLPNGTGLNGTGGTGGGSGGGGTNTGDNQNLYGYAGTSGNYGNSDRGGASGFYGGGAAGTIDLGTGQFCYRGGGGGVRIMWGDTRSFPATLAYNIGGETNN